MIHSKYLKYQYFRLETFSNLLTSSSSARAITV